MNNPSSSIPSSRNLSSSNLSSTNPNSSQNLPTTIIGGGVVGLAVGVGLLEAGVKVTILDGADKDLRASHGNFGLVWVQGKGADYAPYAKWSLLSASLWKAFADKLLADTHIDVSLRQAGGYELFTDQTQFDTFAERLARQKAHLGDDFTYQCFSGDQMREKFPQLGPKLIGATFSPHCGDVNPLKLLRALRLRFQQLGGRLINHFKVSKVVADNGSYHLFGASSEEDSVYAKRVLMCAGLGSAQLAEQLGFITRVKPNRGQLLITERAAPFIDLVSSTVRQVDEGGVQIGGLKENAGFENQTTLEGMTSLAQHAVDVFPQLEQFNLVRAWSALRVMSPDTYPVYTQSKTHEHAYLLTCHSGVTLAAVHATLLPKWILGLDNAPDLEAFDEARFQV